MDKLSTLYNLLYKKHLRNFIDENNIIHKDIENILLCKKAENKQFNQVIKLIEQKVCCEISDEVTDKLAKGDLGDLYFEENKIAINDESINKISELRSVDNLELNESHITNSYKQVVITSNILLTLPKDYDNFQFTSKSLIDMNEQQENWYDHPIPLDIDDKSNEIIYGLTNLSKSIKMETDEIVMVILSVSVTHKSLNLIAKEYIQSKLYDKDVSNLDIYIFTEDECNQLTKTLDSNDKDLQSTLGVCGRYGRHYSFLKAITPLFKQVVNNDVTATFKIDLDQVFPQKELKKATGKYAFENFMSKKWGARGTDSIGRSIKLSMAAGGLVNESDIDDYLFIPDVKKPKDNLNIEQLFFNSSRPQYVSTVGEICKQYASENECIIRYHVTGGVNGILVDDLVRFRPFTPSFFTRAEDQGYLLSVINKEVDGEYMRCAHLDKFVMRHDKEAFLSEDLKHFEIPKSVGDFERMLIFSHYSYDILGCGDLIKQELFPFTGSFVLRRPYTSLLLRLLTRLLSLSETDGNVFLQSFIPRITELINNIDNSVLRNTYVKEKDAYDRYYDMLLVGIDGNVKEKLSEIFKSARINLHSN